MVVQRIIKPRKSKTNNNSCRGTGNIEKVDYNEEASFSAGS